MNDMNSIIENKDKEVVFIMNPTSGKEESDEYKELIESTFSSFFNKVTIRMTESAEDAAKFAEDACRDKVDSVFAVGGDGTVNLVISGLAENEYIPKLGIIPTGTVNNLARILDVPMNPKRAIEMFNPDYVKAIDIGKVNEKYFAYSLSIGDVSEVIHDVSSEEKAKLGAMAYFKEIAKILPNMKLHNLVLDIDGRKIEEEISNIAVLTTNRFFNLRFSECVSNGDGKLSLMLFKEVGLLEGIEMSAKAIAGKLEESDIVDHYRAEKFTVEGDSSIEYDIDGEKGGYLPLEVSILKNHINAYYYETLL